MSNKKQEKSKEKKTKFSFSTLFNSDKFLLAFSFVLSFFIWTMISVSSGETVNYPVSDIPVSLELSEDAEMDNLAVVSIDGVSIDDFTATVKVKGNSVTVGSLTASDIQVYGTNLGNIVTSGTYNVTLQARQLGVKNNYNIVSVNPSEVTVVVDRNVSKELSIENDIQASSPPEYYMGTPVLSEKSVTVTGPEQSVSKVAKAIVSYEFEEELTETITAENIDVVLLDSDDQKINDDSLVLNPITVDVTIPVLLKKTVPFTLSYENAPTGFNAEGFITIEPSQIEIAASSDILNSIDSISLGTIDLSQLSYGTASMPFEVVMPEGVRNFNNIDRVTAQFDFTDFRTKSFVITDFELKNIPDGMYADYSSYRNILVRVIGPKDSVSEITASDVTASVDLTDAKLGTSDYTVEVTIRGNSACWIFGTYDMNITVSDVEPQSESASTGDTEGEEGHGDEDGSG